MPFNWAEEPALEHLVDAHVLLDREQKRCLRVVAADRGSSLSAVLRDAVDHYSRVVTGPTPGRLRSTARAAVGCLQSEAGDVVGGGGLDRGGSGAGR